MSQDFPLGSMSADHFYALPTSVTFRKTDISLDAYNTRSRRMQYPVYMRNMETVWPRRIYVLKGTSRLFAAEDAQATTECYYKIHPDKVIIIEWLLVGNALIYLILLKL